MTRSHKPRREVRTGTWTYPDKADVFAEVGLLTLTEYITRRRQTIATYIRDRPIFDMCIGEKRQRGTSPHQWW